MKSLTDRNFIAHSKTAAYCPRANGKAESSVKMVKAALFRVAHNSFHLWDEFLPAIQAGLNQRVPERTLSAPFTLLFGREFNQSVDYSQETEKLTSVDDWIKHMETMAKHVFPSLAIRTSQRDSQLTSKFPSDHLISEPFSTGSLVMRRVNGLLPKAIPKWEGPYRVLNQSTNSQRYRLLCSDNSVLNDKIPHDQLKLIDRPPESFAYDPTIPTRPSPTTVNLPPIAPISSVLSRPLTRPRGSWLQSQFWTIHLLRSTTLLRSSPCTISSDIHSINNASYCSSSFHTLQ